MKNIIKNFLKKTKFQDRIGEPPYDYYFLKNLDEREYPRYLAKLFYLNTGEKLPLKYDFKNRAWIIDKKRCKTFNQKIQWIKLYGVTDLMRKCTDKVAVRDYVAEKIGSEYLKPVLQVIGDCHCERKRSNPADFKINNNNIGWTATDFFLNLQIQSYYYQPVSLCKSPRSDGKTDALHPKFNDMTTYLLNKKDTSASNGCLPQYDETITDFNTLSHSEPNINSGMKNLYTSSRVDFSQPKQDVTTYFDQINFDKLPNAFVIKCNHGCKWHFIIKDKEAFLQNKRLFDIVKRNMTGWLEQDYSFFGGFEMQYKVKSTDYHCGQVDLNLEPACQSTAEKYNQPDCHVTQNAVVPRNDKYIEPKILIEPLMRDNIDKYVEEINIYCINTKPMFAVKQYINGENSVSYYDENCNSTDAIFKSDDKVVRINADENIKLAFKLSAELSRDFNFVRVDWMLYQNRIYFEELTFTPYSGFNLKIYKYLKNIKEI